MKKPQIKSPSVSDRHKARKSSHASSRISLPQNQCHAHPSGFSGYFKSARKILCRNSGTGGILGF
jgi:hypothetical protein